ncbi:hypothetical protein CsSME_00022380 [Camellia sinensis var. sinensis]
MAASIISSAVVAPAQASMVAPFTGLKSTSAFPVTRKLDTDITSLASNGGRVQCMKVWPPLGLKKFETLSYLPPLTQVLKEVEECKKEYPQSFIRIIGFDNKRQVQCISFICYKPPGF